MYRLDGSCSVRPMACRLAWLAILLMGLAGCADRYGYREPCADADKDCCPPDSHQMADCLDPTAVICVWDNEPASCGDARRDGGADAH